jgi:hypothetical protein
MINGKVYLDETYQTYCKLIENSNIVSTEMKNMIKPRNFSPKMISNLKEEEGEEEEEGPMEKEKNENKFYSLEMSLEKENIIISEIEENKKEIQDADAEEEKEKEKEKDSSPTLIPEPITDEAGNKTKRKYTKKNKEF